MQGLADGYFVIPYTIGNYLAGVKPGQSAAEHPDVRGAVSAVKERVARLLAIKGKRSPTSFHRELGKVMWEYCGMARNKAGLQVALHRLPEIREEFWKNLNVTGEGAELNQALEMAGRVADFLELGELICRDALAREESCGGHFREEYQTGEGEAKRDDDRFCHVAVWEWAGDDKAQLRHEEPLAFETVHLATRSYK
jgi:succinate dehydrogenase / fumarate reductase flavoprotein subunit